MIGKYLKIGMKSAAAMLIALLLVNGLCFFYFNLPPTFRRSENATWMVAKPGSAMRQMMEGAGTLHVDSAGYLNPDLPLKESGYVLALGSSHTAGKEVKQEERYTSLLNEMLGGGDKLNVYNMGADGHGYTAMMRGFNAAVQEFPNSSAVVLELSKTYYEIYDLVYALDQREFDESKTAKAFFESLSPSEKRQVVIKENLPFLMLLKNKQFAKMQPLFYSAFGRNKPEPKPEYDFDEAFMNAYSEAIGNALAMLRGEYDGKIIILYHPEATPNDEGGLDFDEDPKSLDAFMRACEANGVTFVNMKDAFNKEYEESHTVPFGFENTAFGTGHLNKYGHRLVAEELYPLLCGEQTGAF